MVKSKEYAEIFMLMLLHYYRKFKENGLVEPEEVKVRTSDYKKESNIYSQFVEDRLVKDDGAHIKSGDAYKAFRTWYTDQNSDRCPGKREFNAGMIRCIGKMAKGTKWRGYALRTDDDDDEYGEDTGNQDYASNSDTDSDNENEVDI